MITITSESTCASCKYILPFFKASISVLTAWCLLLRDYMYHTMTGPFGKNTNIRSKKILWDSQKLHFSVREIQKTFACRKSCRFPGTLLLPPDTFLLISFSRFSLVAALMLSFLYVSHATPTLVQCEAKKIPARILIESGLFVGRRCTISCTISSTAN